MSATTEALAPGTRFNTQWDYEGYDPTPIHNWVKVGQDAYILYNFSTRYVAGDSLGTMILRDADFPEDTEITVVSN